MGFGVGRCEKRIEGADIDLDWAILSWAIGNPVNVTIGRELDLLQIQEHRSKSMQGIPLWFLERAAFDGLIILGADYSDQPRLRIFLVASGSNGIRNFEQANRLAWG